MEKEGIVEMFLRSADKNNLKYAKYIGVGDSNSFITIKQKLESKSGQEYQIEKENCISHIQKHKKITTKISERKRKRKDCPSYIVGASSSHKTLVTLVPTVQKKKITKTKIPFIHDDSVELVVKISIYESFNIIYFYAFKDFHICLMSRYMPHA